MRGESWDNSNAILSKLTLTADPTENTAADADVAVTDFVSVPD